MRNLILFLNFLIMGAERMAREAFFKGKYDKEFARGRPDCLEYAALNGEFGEDAKEAMEAEMKITINEVTARMQSIVDEELEEEQEERMAA